MRPLKLTVSAFGPFADTLTLDFTCLEGQNLFLIHGPTGSGKTSILDAICYALYGETSGDVRNIKHIRSDHANISTETRVLFEFELGDATYRVERSPEQIRPKLRGTGDTKTDPEAVITRLRSGNEVEDQIICSKQRDVTPKIVDLLGFRVEQFRQVIMLPQGEFRKLLSETSERSKILETLFQTEYYSRIQNALREAAKDLERTVGKLDDQINALLSTYDAETVEEINTRCSLASEELKTIDSQNEILAQKQEISRKLITQAYDVKRILDEYDSAKQRMQTLQNLSSEYTEKQHRFEAARKAELLREVLKTRDDRNSEHEAAKKNHLKMQGNFISAERALEEAIIVFKTEENLEPERERIGLEIQRLRDVFGKVEQLDAESRKYSELNDLFKKHEKTNSLLSQGLQNLENEKVSLLKIQDDAKTTAAKSEHHKMILDDLKATSALISDIAKRKEKLTESRNKLFIAQSACEQIEAEYRHSRLQFDELQILWQNGQSAILAGTLQSGLPCPVCGSTEHPDPAKSEAHLPTEAELNHLKNEIVDLETGLNRERSKVANCEKDVETIATEINLLSGKLDETVDLKPEIILEKLRIAEQNIAESESANTVYSETVEKLERLATKREKIERDHELAWSELNTDKAKLDQQTGLLQELEKQVPEDLRDIKRLTAKIEKSESELTNLKRRFENARLSVSNAERELAASQATLKAAKDTEIQTHTAFQAAKNVFNDKLQTSGFLTELELLSAMLESEEVSKLDSEIQKYKDNCAAAQDRLSEMEIASKNLDMPEIEALESEAKTIKTELDICNQQRADLQAQITQMKTNLKTLEKFALEKEKVYDQHRINGELSDVANGKNDLGITFQNFVLSTFLDDVLVAASERLKLMSKGRYTLYRSGESGDMRKKQGLDIFIDDSYTGIPRPVSTFSGGESFQASLALALGLTDVVQSHAGGITLDTIFIDEGFGNLDSEALDLALRALVDLRESGRLVGIISHVPELKERIDVCVVEKLCDD